MSKSKINKSDVQVTDNQNNKVTDNQNIQVADTQNNKAGNQNIQVSDNQNSKAGNQNSKVSDTQNNKVVDCQNDDNGYKSQNPPPRRRVGGPMAGPMMKEKAKNSKKTFIQLTKYCKKYVPLIVFVLVVTVIATILTVIGPSKVKDLTNLINEGVPQFDGQNWIVGVMDLDAIGKIALFLACIYGLSVVFQLVGGYIMATVTQKISKNMRTDIGIKINKLPFSYYNKVSYGDVLSRVTNDVDTIGQTLNQSLDTLLWAITMIGGSVIMMFVTNWLLAFTAIGSSVLGFVLMMFIMKKSQKHFVVQQSELGKINGHIEEIYTGHNVVKVYNGSQKAKQTFEEINMKLRKSAWKSQFLSGLMMPLMVFVGNLGTVSVCVVGAVMAAKNIFGIGTIIAFMMYINMFSRPLSQLAQAANNLQRTAAASERVFEFLNEKELEDESMKVKKLENIQGNIEFKNVKFGYLPEKTVINNFSASVKAGQKVAIVGPTGAGKTTMVNLLMRFYEVGEGSITFDGIDIAQVTRENIHEQFCMVLQDTWLFEGTIKDNIIYSKDGVTDEDVINACKTVGLHHFIQTLPQGYDTVLNDKTSLSEGQKQLLTIARAVIKNSPLLILDEATSSVDTRTERIVQTAMDRLLEGRTSFVIAHRLSTIKNADLILVMKNGDIIESGNHQQLLENGGFYAELYNSQFEAE